MRINETDLLWLEEMAKNMLVLCWAAAADVIEVGQKLGTFKFSTLKIYSKNLNMSTSSVWSLSKSLIYIHT